MLLNVTEYRKRSAGGMLCCHSVRAGPRSRYTERGSKISEARSQPLPRLRLKRNRHDELKEIPMTSR